MLILINVIFNQLPGTLFNLFIHLKNVNLLYTVIYCLFINHAADFHSMIIFFFILMALFAHNYLIQIT